MGIEFEIRYNTPRHKVVLDAILERYKKSKKAMEEQYPRFKKSEEAFQAYLPEKEVDRLRREDREQNGNPHYTTIVVPYNYAQLMTAHTYWTSVFLARNPVFQYQARHGEPQNKVEAVEALIDYQVLVGKHLVPLYGWLLDPGKYGFGIVGVYWEDEKKVISEIVEEQVTFAGFAISGKTRKVRKIREIPGYQGNRVFNVSPRNFFPDPSVPLCRMQEGEFCGHETILGWNTIKRRAENKQYFNVDILERMSRVTENRDRDYGSSQTVYPEPELTTETTDLKDPGAQKILEMTVEIIPKEWQLGTREYPEKWVFTVADERVIIGARPLGCLHDMYPYAVLEYEPDMYSLMGRSMMDMTAPLTDVMTWLVNSHMYNVRQTLNNQFVGDPSRISFRDLSSGEPGFIARVKPAGYGQDPRTMITQLTVSDVTGNHIRDSQMMERLIQQVTGVNDNIMGMVNAGGRKTATEARQAANAGANRLKTSSEFFSAMGFADLSQMLVQNSQQYFTQERRFRVVGDLVEGQDPFLEVTPESIAGFYDYVPVDGTLPVDRFAQANLWRQIFADMQKFPQLLQAYDMPRVFSYVAKLAGAKNFDQFKIQMQTPGQVQQGVQAGNLVPVNKMQGAEALEGVGEPGQIPGMGQTG